jgi:hypothetical protein
VVVWPHPDDPSLDNPWLTAPERATSGRNKISIQELPANDGHRGLWTVGGALGRVFGSRAAVESVGVLEDGAKFSRERLRLAGVSGLAAEEAAVVAREHGRLLIE